MEKKQTIWKTKGMNQDLSVSAFNNEFSFENMNLRLSTNEGNTLMSWVNEKGTSLMHLSISIKEWEEDPIIGEIIQGCPIGTAVINHQLVLFTTDPSKRKGFNTSPDNIYIFRFSSSADTLDGRLLYSGNLNFSEEHPIETLVSYESDTVQKVYWTDGYNQPRVINVAASLEKLEKWNSTPVVGAIKPIDTFFDFVPALDGNEEITITKHTSSGGIFAPGVIQYALSYVNIYGQQSNLFYVSPLYYLSPYDRGARPDEKVTASFEIEINHVDQRFDYLRIYSIQRTSLNDTPIVKLLDTLTTTSDTLKYTDSGTTGASMDPTELIFVGGKEITALTMVDKDQTLFLGNLEEKNSDVSAIQDYYDNLRGENGSDSMGISYHNDGELKKITLDTASSIYSHTNMLNYSHRQATTFKGGETYRFGFQLQKKTGDWTEPIFMNDVLNDCYPKTDIFQNDVNLTYASAEIDFSNFGLPNFYDIYQRIRPVIVFPTIGDRTVLCQGVLNPTVFNVKDRKTSSPYSQASWYFRPYMLNGDTSSIDNNYINKVDPIDTVTYTNRGTVIVPEGLTPMSKVSVLVGSLSTMKYDEVVTRKYLKVNIGGNDRPEYYDGIIKLGYSNNITGHQYYAFIKKEGLFASQNSSDPQNPQASFVGFDYQDFDSGSLAMDNPGELIYRMYSNMVHVNDGTYRYVPPEGTPDTSPLYNSYTFEFCAGDYKYSVLFNATNTDYEKITYDSSGQMVAYKHYDSLYTQSECSGNNLTIDNARRIEIQGSIKTYDNVGDTTATGSSNTQFFVDQSVVTLNSPDIEFDTEVQAYGTEGMHLRIVGIIPITANASAHSFVHTAMMEKMVSHTDAGGNVISNAVFGSGELDINILHSNINPFAGKRLVSEFLWHDNYVRHNGTNEDGSQKWEAVDLRKFLVYPWHRKGSLNNDTRGVAEASSYLQQKKESNILYSINSSYLDNVNTTFTNFGIDMILTENAEVMNYRLPSQTKESKDVNYYPNIDKVLYNDVAYNPIVVDTNDNIAISVPVSGSSISTDITSPVSMKYLSTSHAVIAFREGADGYVPILPSVLYSGTYKDGNVDVPYSRTCGTFSPDDHGATIENGHKVINSFWGDKYSFSQSSIDVSSNLKYNNNTMPLNLLWLAELYKDVPMRFGGKGKEALRSNNWLVGGDAVNISQDNPSITLTWTEGDTYYQRYDCLKTYAMTNDDSNQLVEILSFMCETHTNIDGRYDRNRGQIDNTNMRPQNFNLLNPVYSQQDNFFTSKKIQTEEVISHHYPNHVTWSKTKESGADVDMWTNVTLASTMELDGDKGKISKLARLNDSLLAFQDTGISQILYNENVQIASTAGVPIEIANSGKVQGKRYISDTIGCSNKWSVCQTPSGIYFIDSHDKGIYLFNGQLQNLSVAGGFNSWSKQHISITENGWTPLDFNDFITQYDKQNKDVLFISNDEALAYSEKIGAFTSFYNYNRIPYLCNLDGSGIWIKSESYSAPNPPYGRVIYGLSSLWGHQTGEYNNFFGNSYPYWMTLVGNPDPQRDKTFTNLEFRACVDGDGEYSENTGKFTPTLPFSTLETWNEYQHGITALKNKIGHASMMHHTLDKESALKRKFRIWRCDIPRDNASLNTDAGLNISRFKAKPLDRMRNPWIYLKLYKGDNTGKRVEIHDVMMSYYE